MHNSLYLFHGSNYKARLVESGDAQTIFDWRKSVRARYLNAIPDDIQEQYGYIERARKKFDAGTEAYVIIENLASRPVGCLRITELNSKNQLNYHSLFFIDSIDPNITLNVIFSIYQLCFEVLERDIFGPFPVNKNNTRVIKLHRLMPLSRETLMENDFVEFKITRESFENKRAFFIKLGFGILECDVSLFKINHNEKPCIDARN